MISRKTRLSTRLGAILAAIPADATTVADIGYDRGQLMAALIARRPNTSVVGVEVQPGAGPRALATHEQLRAHPERVTLVTGDGPSGLAECPGNPVDGAVLAGIGGRTIAQLLLRDRAVIAGLSWLVLCPPRFNGAIRPALETLGWHVAAESLVTDRGRTYEIIVGRPGRVAVDSPLAARFGPCLFARQDPALRPYLLEVRRRFAAAFARDLVDYGPTSNKPKLGEKLALLDAAIAETERW